MSRDKSIWEHLAFVALAVVLSVIPATTVWMVASLYGDMCFGDQLNFFAHSRMGDGLTLARLFSFFNEHQMVFTRLTVYIDYVWLNGSNVLSFVVNALLLLGVWAVYCVVLKQSSAGFSRRQFMVCCGLLLTLYCNGQMLLNLTFPVMEFPWTCFLAVCGFFLFSRLPFAWMTDLRPRSRFLRVSLLFLALVAAALSCAGGLLCGPSILVLLALLLLWSKAFPKSVLWKLTATVLGMSGLIIVSYVGAYLAVSGGTRDRPGFGLVSIARFLYLFVGGPFFNDTVWPIVYHSNILALLLVPTLFWCVLALLAVQLFRRRDNLTAFELFHWCIIIFVLLTAASGSLFRAQLGSLEGLSKKYVSITLMAWISTASLALFYWPALLFGKHRRSRLLPLAICSAVVALLMSGGLIQFRMWRVWQAQVRETVSSVASEVYSADLLRRLYHKGPAGYAASREFVREYKYCYRRMPSPGYRIQERFQTVASPGAGSLATHITSVRDRPGHEGFLATGETANHSTEFPAVVIADTADRVLGYGTVTSISQVDGSVRRVGEWFAAFQRPPGFSGTGTFRVYSLQGQTATLAGTIAVEEKPVPDARVKAASRALARVADNTDYSLNILNGVQPSPGNAVHLPEKADLALTGWAVDRDRSALPAAVDVVIDDVPYAAQDGNRRHDVASFFHQPNFEWCGYSFTLPAARLATGPHQLRIRIYTAGAGFHLDSAIYPFVVD